MSHYVLDIPYDEEASSTVVGGKAFALNKLAKHKINIPNTDVLTVNAFEDFVETNRLETFSTFLGNDEKLDHQSIRTRFLEIQNTYEEGNIPSVVNVAINEWLNQTKNDLFAVRSSANCEDGVSRAWAGQFHSFLNTPKSKVKENIKKCWASVFSLGVYYYSKKYESTLNEIEMAVVLQEMVPASIAGVCFTSNPVNNDNNQIVIEFCEGLGEVLVASLITPNNYILDKSTGDVVNYRCGNQKKVLRYGVGETVLETNGSSDFCNELTRKQLDELRDMAVRLENLFGAPQDFEWAFVGDQLCILQSRNITTIS